MSWMMDTHQQDRSAGEPDEPVVMSPAFKADAHGQYARLRAKRPVHPARFFRGITGWVVVDYDWPVRR
jgi:hypothetical protein